MSTQQQVFDLIKTLTEDRAILTVPRLFVRMFDLKTGYFLSQLLYWSDKGTRKDGFFWKTTAEWIEETGLSDYAIRSARQTLEKAGVIETKVMRAMGSPTVHYRFNQEAFTQAVLDHQQMDSLKSTNPTCENQQIQPIEINESLTIDYSNKIPQEKHLAQDSSKPSRVSAGSCKKSSVPPAVTVFRSETQRYPAKSWYADLEKIQDLDRWRSVVHAYIGLG